MVETGILQHRLEITVEFWCLVVAKVVEIHRILTMTVAAMKF